MALVICLTTVVAKERQGVVLGYVLWMKLDEFYTEEST
jgi:hypothetical protein